MHFFPTPILFSCRVFISPLAGSTKSRGLYLSVLQQDLIQTNNVLRYTIITYSTAVTQRSVINDQLTHSKYFSATLRKVVFYKNHMYRKTSYCDASKLGDYYKIARSFTLFSLRKHRQLHHYIS